MTRTVKFIPVAHGTKVDLGDIGIFGLSGRHKFIGFKPSPGRRRGGWLVVLVDGGPPPRPLKRRPASRRG